MQSDETRNPLPAPEAPPKRPGWGERLKAFDSQFSIAKGLGMVTLLTGLVGGYFQYLNAYQEKVSADAKTDMAAATSTFVDISNAFAEAQMLQQIIFFDFMDILSEKTDAGDKAMSTKNAHDILPKYIAARTALRQNSNILARKAEIYVDWASDLGRDPAEPRTIDTDPLSEALLGKYNFDCRTVFPLFESKDNERGKPQTEKCVPEESDEDGLKKSYVRLCPREDGQIIAGKPVKINWYSAKHHVLTMHYCFENAHRELETARIWASDNEVSEQRKSEFLARSKQYRADLNNEIDRLNKFMTLVMTQLDRIRVKYRPSGVVCHVPLLREVIDLFSNKCTPVRTAAGENIRQDQNNWRAAADIITTPPAITTASRIAV